jgi:hypothetical protein
MQRTRPRLSQVCERPKLTIPGLRAAGAPFLSVEGSTAAAAAAQRQLQSRARAEALPRVPAQHMVNKAGEADAWDSGATLNRGMVRPMTGIALVSRPFLSWNRPILTEIYLCHACSYHEFEDGNGRAGWR